MSERVSSRSIPACRVCGIGFDPVHGCVHTVSHFVPAPMTVNIGPGGCLLIDSSQPVVIAVSPTTGLPLTDRW